MTQEKKRHAPELGQEQARKDAAAAAGNAPQEPVEVDDDSVPGGAADDNTNSGNSSSQPQTGDGPSASDMFAALPDEDLVAMAELAEVAVEGLSREQVIEALIAAGVSPSA